MAAVLAAGNGAVLSHTSAVEVLAVGPVSILIHVTVPPSHSPRLAGIAVHRRDVPASERGTCNGIPVTSPARTLCDIACQLPPVELARAVDEADKLDLIDPEALRSELNGMRGRPGVVRLRTLLDRHTFVLTDSELELRFIPIARAAGLPLPLTRQRLNGFRVDFYWPDLGLVVETDGLRYHRTAAAQTRALHRDQTHFRSGLLPLRFSHYQVAFEREDVRTALEEGLRRCVSRA